MLEAAPHPLQEARERCDEARGSLGLRGGPRESDPTTVAQRAGAQRAGAGPVLTRAG